MGTSIFINPSNPFFLDTGKFNPKIETSPMDFVEMSFASTVNSNFTFTANLARGEAKNTYNNFFLNFNRSYAIGNEYYGSSYYIGSNLLLQENLKRGHLGFYGQKNIGDAWIVWVDGALKYNPNRFYPVKGHSLGLLDYEMVNGEKNKKIYFNGLLGVSYTMNSGPIFYLEYYYNGMGYSKEEMKLYKNMIEDSKYYHFDTTMSLVRLNLGRVLNSGMLYTKQNYIFTQLNQNEIFNNQVNYSLRYFHSFDDNSSSASALLEWDILSNLQFYILGVVNFGGKYSDFNKLINSQIMGGSVIKF